MLRLVGHSSWARARCACGGRGGTGSLLGYVLFLLPNVASATGHVPGKLFDYLGAGNPILGLGPKEGDASEIIKGTTAGAVFDYKDLTAIAEYIRRMKEQDAPRTDASAVQAYARDVQAKRLLKEILRN